MIPSKTVSIIHLVDSLVPGGAERVAVNLSNALGAARYKVTLCATRKGGSLQDQVSSRLNFVCLHKKSRFDFRAIIALLKIIRSNDIEIIHAHSSSLFMGALAKVFMPKVKLIFHIHAGSFGDQKKINIFYRLMIHQCDAVISVTNSIAAWMQREYPFLARNIVYIPNFIMYDKSESIKIHLAGDPGYRIVFLANLRPEKDHITLVRALEIMTKVEEKVHLFLVGANANPGYASLIFQEIEKRDLSKKISWLGARNDVPSILASCDLGVLSSSSEGFPLSLLEYGIFGLPVVCTDVGECSSILDNGLGGLLVEPGNPQELAEAVIRLLRNIPLQKEKSNYLQATIKNRYTFGTGAASGYKDLYVPASRIPGWN